MPTLVHIVLMFGLCFGFQNKLPFLYGRSSFTDKLLHCSYCLGFHCGWLAWLLTALMAWSWPEATVQANLASLVVWAFVGSASCYLLDTVMKRVEESVPAFREYVQVIAAANGFSFEEEADEEEADEEP